jgi:hypothetical protein
LFTQITRTTPFLLTILHLGHIFLTDALTFIALSSGSIRNTRCGTVNDQRFLNVTVQGCIRKPATISHLRVILTGTLSVHG